MSSSNCLPGDNCCAGANTTVPAQWQSWVQQASQGTGIPEAIVAAQISCESSYNPNAGSPKGAHGIAQFLDSTLQEYVPGGDAYNPQDALKGYIAYMNSLMKRYGGNIQEALQAYDAGTASPGGPGSSYATNIMAAAHANPNLTISNNAGSGNAPQTGGANAGVSGCADGFPVFFGFGSECVLSKAQALKLFGYIVMGAGGIMGLAGLVLLAVGGLKSTGASAGIHKSAQTLAKPIEKLTPVGRLASKAQKHAPSKKAAPAGKRKPVIIRHYPEAKRSTPLTTAAADESRRRQLHNQNVVPF